MNATGLTSHPHGDAWLVGMLVLASDRCSGPLLILTPNFEYSSCSPTLDTSGINPSLPHFQAVAGLDPVIQIISVAEARVICQLKGEETGEE